MKEEYVRHLFKLNSAYTPAVIEATVEHLSYGLSQQKAADKQNIPQSTVGRAVSRIRRTDKLLIEAIMIKIS